MGWLAPIGLLFVLMFGMSLASTSSPPSKDEKRQVAFYKTCEDLKAGPDGVVTMAPGVAKFLPPIFCEPAVVSEGELVLWRLPLGGLEIHFETRNFIFVPFPAFPAPSSLEKKELYL